MTPAQADKAIKAGSPITVTTIHNIEITITITARDRRYVEATYEYEGRTFTGKFERRDLTIRS